MKEENDEPVCGEIYNAICMMLWDNLPENTMLKDANGMAFEIYKIMVKDVTPSANTN